MATSGRDFSTSQFDGERESVAIVGGGIAGWSAAYWLGQRGIASVVIDADASPRGATARNAGCLMTGTASSYADAVRTWGRSEAAYLESLTFENRDRILDTFFPDRSGVQPIGSWRLAESAEEELELRESLELLREDGFDYDWIESETARRELCSDRFFGGLQQRGDCGVDPLVVLQRIAAASGASRICGRVEAIEETSNEVQLRLDSGASVRADRALITLNAYSSLLLPALDGVIVPVRAQALTTEPLPREVWRHLVYSHYGYYYFRQLPDLRLLIGGARHLYRDVEVGTEDATTAALQATLEDFLSSVACADARVERRWSGVMGFTADGKPLARRLHADRETVLILGGFNGHGMGMAFESARRLVEKEF